MIELTLDLSKRNQILDGIRVSLDCEMRCEVRLSIGGEKGVLVSTIDNDPFLSQLDSKFIKICFSSKVA
jgi:hypothetical protein